MGQQTLCLPWSNITQNGSLTIRQDKIGWQNFMEGCISTHFYFIQHYHLALSGSYLNGSDWTKSLISKLLCNLQKLHTSRQALRVSTQEELREHLTDHRGVSRHSSRRGTRGEQVPPRNQLRRSHQVSYQKPTVLGYGHTSGDHSRPKNSSSR